MVTSVITAIVSAFLDNVTTVVLLTPITFFVAQRLGTSPVPFLISQVLASNIANADTPNFQARDFDFGAALARATARLGPAVAGVAPGTSAAAATMRVALTQPGAAAAANKAFLPIEGSNSPSRPPLLWRTPEQPSLDRNTVDLDRERANFADNSLRYEATLRFINGHVRNVLSAIRGD